MMFRNVVIIAVVLLLIIFPCKADNSDEQKNFLRSLNLSQEENEWIEKDYLVRMPVDLWAPFNYYDNSVSSAKGILVDYLRWIKEKTGIRFQFAAHHLPLVYVLEELKNKELDFSPSLHKTSERKKYLAFTKPVFYARGGFYTHSDYIKNKSIAKDSNLVISVEESSKTHLFIKDHFPYHEIIPVNTEKEGLLKVKQGLVDVHAGIVEVADYLLKNDKQFDDVVFHSDIEGLSPTIHMAARKDWAPLASIVDKAMDKMPASKRLTIVNENTHQVGWQKYKRHMLMALCVFLFVLVASLFVLYYLNKRLKKQKNLLLLKDKRINKAMKMANLHFIEYDVDSRKAYLTAEGMKFFNQNPNKNEIDLRTIICHIYPDDLSWVKHKLRDWKTHKNKDFSFRAYAKHGQLYHFNCHLSYLHDKDKSVVLISLLDITKQSVFNNRLLETQRLAKIGHYSFYPELNKIFLSQEALTILKINNPDKGISLFELRSYISYDNMHAIFSKLKEAIERKDQSFNYSFAENKQGKTIYYHTSNNISYAPNGKVNRLRGFVQNISIIKEQEMALIKAKEEAEKANQAKNLFLARVSHEIRTPLTVISGMVDSLIQTSLNKKQKTLIQKAKGANNHLIHLIEDLLDFPSIESGNISLNQAPLNVHLITREIMDLLSDKMDQKTLNSSLTIDPEIDEYLLGDEKRLKQVLMNLITNAIKFSDNGHILLGVKRISDKDKYMLEFSVKDNGIGISPVYFNKIFDSFKQLDHYNTGNSSGVGLGLAISKKIVEQWGGKIWVDSIPGQGSTFFFTFPYQKIMSSSKNKYIEQEKDKDISKDKPRFLLAEDNLAIQEIGRDIFSSWDIHLDIVNNGQEALQKMNNQTYDIIFLDVNMPVIDGIQTARQIRMINKLNRVPVIAVTADGYYRKRKACMDAGMNDLITKPFTRKDIEHVLSKHQIPLTVKEQGIVDEPSPVSPPVIRIDDDNKDYSLVDFEQIKIYLGDDQQKLNNYFLSFQRKCSDKSSEIEKLCNEKNGINHFKAIVHNIKGESGFLGLYNLHDLCQSMLDNVNLINKEACFLKVKKALKEVSLKEYEWE